MTSVFFMVEVGGVEPPSESTSTGLSPGAVDYLWKSSFLFPAKMANRHAIRLGELHDLWHRQSLLYAHLPLNDALLGSRSFRVGRLPLIRQRKQQYCRYLIYKVARFMAVRPRRPLVPPPYPRRNRYTPKFGLGPAPQREGGPPFRRV